MMLPISNYLGTNSPIARLAAGAMRAVRDTSAGVVRPAFHDGRRPAQLGLILPDSTVALLPSASQLALDTRISVLEPAPTGLTRPPASTQTSRLPLINTLAGDGSRVLRPDGRRDWFTRAGNFSNPVLAAFTLTGATGTIGELTQSAAGLFAVADTVVEFALLVARTTGSTGTPSAGLLVGGVPIGVAAFAANANSVAHIYGRMWVRTPTTQSCTYTATPGGAANIGSSGGSMNTAIALGSAQTWSVGIISGGTSGDAFAVVSVAIAVSGA